MPEYSELIRMKDQEAHGMVRELVKHDRRSIGEQVAWLIRQEYARRFSQPNELITIQEAITAQQALEESTK